MGICLQCAHSLFWAHPTSLLRLSPGGTIPASVSTCMARLGQLCLHLFLAASVLAAFILQETLAANVAVFLRAVGVRGEVSSLPVLTGQPRISEKHQPTTLQDPNQRTGSESECGIHRCRSGGCRSLRVSRVHHCAETVSPEPSGPVRVCSLVGNDRPLH